MPRGAGEAGEDVEEVVGAEAVSQDQKGRCFLQIEILTEKFSLCLCSVSVCRHLL